MITKTINLYTIDELEPKAKEYAIRKWIENDDLPFLEEYIAEELQELLKKYGFTDAKDIKPYYSLSYRQGDGAMFEGSVTWGKLRAHIKHNGHYYHYNSKTIDLTRTDTDDEATEKEYKEFNEQYVALCRELEKVGYKYIEDAQSEENVIDDMRANDITFRDNGRLESI